ncbi:MAG: radical SAM protein [Chloroflexota bacterium]|nr:radical SAM protein [Chloroflexota bacterium]
MTRAKIPQPISGGLLLSYKCSAECRHCMYACSPKWKGDWITREGLEEILSQLAGRIRPSPWGGQTISLNYGLHFTGGEPFLNFALLVEAVAMAEELKIPSTFVETNCFWCSDDEATRERLEFLKAAGLKGILISVNPFYAEHVPFERTERCIRISQEVFGGNVVVYQLAYYDRFKQLGIKERMPLEDYLELTSGERLMEQVELFLMGRAARQLRGFYPTYPAHTFFDEPCRPPFLRNWHNHFDNYGNFMPGYCGGISLGHWKNLDVLVKEGIDLDEHPVLRFLIAEDVQGLFHFASDFGYQESREGYVSKCDLCLDLRSHLVSKEDFEELSPKEFYAHLG